VSAVFKYMAKQAVDCRNMVVTVSMAVAHPHHCLRNYSQRILTYCTRILLLDLTYGHTMVSTLTVLWRCWLGGRKGIWPVKT